MSDLFRTRRDILKVSAASAALAPSLLAAAPVPSAEDELSRVRAARRLLLKGGIVLTLDPAIGDFPKADVLIDNGRIADIRPDILATDAVEVDCANRILIPGFVDTHVHSYQGLLRSLLPNGLVDPDYNRDIQNNLTLHYRPEDVYAGVLVTALALIDMGTTSIVDLSQISHSPEHSDANVRALQESGIRAVFAYSRGSGPESRYPEDLARLQRTYFNSNDQLLTLALAASTEPQSFRLARDHGLQAVLHIRVNSEALLALGRAGLLREGDELVHCTHLNGDAWNLIKDSGTRTSHSPPLEMAMAHGFPAIQAALDHGVRPSLSSDHSATVAQDMFGVMRTAFNLQRLTVLQRIRAGENNAPPLLTAREVLEFATIEGARCARVDGKCGTLTIGKDADIVVLRADMLDVWPCNNAIGTAVNLMNPGHVESVFIAGNVRKWRGALVNVDIARIRALAAQSRDAVLRRGGLALNVTG